MADAAFVNARTAPASQGANGARAGARPRIWLLAIGDELLRGAIVDRHTSYLGAWCRARGLELRGATMLGDDEHVIAGELIRLAAGRECDAIVTTGGLGPTTDDRTARALALAAGVPLIRDLDAQTAVSAACSARGRAPTEGDLRSADLPAGARALPNPRGVAPGIVVSLARSPGVSLTGSPGGVAEAEVDAPLSVYALPGVPGEFHAMIEGPVGDALLRVLSPAPAPMRTFLIAGLSEWDVQVRMDAWMGAAGAQGDVVGALASLPVAYRCQAPWVFVTLGPAPAGGGSGQAHPERGSSPRGGAELARPQALEGSLDRAQQDASLRWDRAMSDAFGDALIAVGEAPLQARLIEHARARGLRLATAESCTGGRVAAALSSIAGASDCLLGGVVAYTAQTKGTQLGVPAELIAREGIVSEAVARAMVRGVQQRWGADACVAVTGWAGPGPEGAPVGTVCVAASMAEEISSVTRRFRGDREEVQRAATRLALTLLWRAMGGADAAHRAIEAHAGADGQVAR